jgi:hypothetical protein
MTPAKWKAILVQAENKEAQQESMTKSSKLMKMMTPKKATAAKIAKEAIHAKKATPAKRKAESSKTYFDWLMLPDGQYI